MTDDQILAATDRAIEPDFVVIDVETACARSSSICQIGIVGFRDGRETFAYETLVDPRDEFHPDAVTHDLFSACRIPTFVHVH